MLLEESDKEKRFLIGHNIKLMRHFRENIVRFLFTSIDENSPRERTVENFEGAEEIFEVIDAYINGENPDAIGESVFQNDGEPVIKILNLFGINPEK